VQEFGNVSYGISVRNQLNDFRLAAGQDGRLAILSTTISHNSQNFEDQLISLIFDYEAGPM